MTTWLSKLRTQSLPLRALWLTSASLLTFGLTAPVAWHCGGAMALAAAALAGGLCLLGAMLALVTSHLLRGPELALPAMLIGMALRATPPLFSAVAIHITGGPLAEAGVLYYLVVFYLTTLAAETALSLPVDSQPAGAAAKPLDPVR